MLIRTEAIVLRSIDYGETSRIVTLFTRDKGRITVIAKGARRPKSQFGSSLEPMSYIQAVFYYKGSRGIQTLKESAHVEPMHRIQRSLRSIGIGLRVLELVYVLLQKEEESPHIFRLTLSVLRRLNRDDRRLENLLPYFQMRMATLLGFAPALTRGAIESLTSSHGRLALDTGAILPRGDHHRPAPEASRGALRAYAVFARASLEDVMRMELTRSQRRETEHLISDYLRYHVEEAYPDRSERIIAQLMQDDPPGVAG